MIKNLLFDQVHAPVDLLRSLVRYDGAFSVATADAIDDLVDFELVAFARKVAFETAHKWV
jgi:hypothetical protein